MAEASSTETQADEKPRKKTAKKRSGPSSPPPEGEWFTRWRTWGVLGLVLVGGVVGWKLLGSTYKGDVETVCNAQAGSGFTMDKDMSKVTGYIRDHLATPEGNTFFSSLSDAKLAERAKRLESESSTLGIKSCPMVAAFERLAAAGEYRGDVQRLCSNATFPHFGEADDATRLQRLEDWIDQQAKSPRTKELAEPLRQGTPANRAKFLRDTGNKVDIFSCELARTLEGPILPAKGKGPPVVRPYAEPQIIGVLKPEDLAKAIAQITPAMNDCYKVGLEKNPDLEGKLAVKFKVDPAGKVSGVAPADTTVPDRPTAECILQLFKGMELPKNPGPLVSIFIPLELTTTTFLPPPGTTPPPPAIAAPGTSGGRPPVPSPASSKH